MSQSKQVIGQLGEKAAASFLQRKGYEIIARNWRCRSGEIDLVAQLNDVLIIVEVRTRRSTRHGTAVESIDRHKQNKLRSLALIYQQLERKQQRTVRFDVIAIQLNLDESIAELNHIENAFS